MSIISLPQDTVHLLKSGQVISSVYGAIKELVENSLDAGSTNVEVRLEDYGLAKLEVRDNGGGVEKSDVPGMVQPHSTSKISSFAEVENVLTYGFRGEALSALCAVSTLQITTKTKTDLVASTFSFKNDFTIQKIDSQAGKPGTTVTASNLFSNLPVRRHYYKDVHRKKEELKKVERVIAAFSIINPGVRFSIHHNKSNIFGKISCSTISQSFGAVLGQTSRTKMNEFSLEMDPVTGQVTEQEVGIDPNPLIKLHLFIILPKKFAGMAVELGRTGPEKTFIFINKRPVEHKELEKVLKRVFSSAAGLETEKYPVSLLSITVGAEERKHMDANLEPNKQKVGLGFLAQLCTGLEEYLERMYGLNKNGANIITTEPLELNTTSPESCFTMIGETQPWPEEKENFDHGTVSQFFARHQGKKNVGTGSDSPETPAIQPETWDARDNEEEPRRTRSPVLKPEMFQTPELPGLDAVYINRLKDGDFTEVDEEDELDFVAGDSGYQLPENPFIQFETEVGDCVEDWEDEERLNSDLNSVGFSSGDISGSESEKKAQGGLSSISVSAWATGRIKSECGEILQPVKLHSTLHNLNTGFTPGSNSGPKPESGRYLHVEPEKVLQSSPESGPTRRNELKKRKLDESTPRIDMFLQTSVKKRKEEPALKPKTRVVSVPFKLSICRRRKEEETMKSGLIGTITTDKGEGWVYSGDGELNLIHPLRLKERMIYDRLLASHPLPSSKLTEPIILHPGSLEDVQVRTLLSLYTNTKQCPARVTDTRLTLNGFDIVKYELQNGDALFKLEGTNTDIQFYGLSDLQEVLNLISRSQVDSVSASRPEKVRTYLRNEASRIVRDSTTRILKDEVESLVEYKNTSGATICSHSKPLYTCIHEFA